MNSNSNGLSKNERRQQAREQARQAREAQQKREKRNRLLIQGGVAAAIIGLLAVAAIVITSTLRPSGPAVFPGNMASGGVVFTEGLKVQETPTLEEGADFVPTEIDTATNPVDVRVFVDFMCPACGAFEQTYGPMLEQYTNSGDVNLEISPVNFLDPQSAGTKYSTRAASAFACVVDEQPDNAFAYFQALFADQPAEGTTAHNDEKLIEIAGTAGVEITETFTNCVNTTKFGPFFDRTTQQALQDGILGLADGAVLLANPTTGETQPEGEAQRLVSTPTVIVNGEQWVQNRDGDLEQFILKIMQSNGDTATAGTAG